MKVVFQSAEKQTVKGSHLDIPHRPTPELECTLQENKLPSELNNENRQTNKIHAADSETSTEQNSKAYSSKCNLYTLNKEYILNER